VEDGKLDVEVSETADDGLWGVSGILEDAALGIDNDVAGIGGMAEGRGTVVVRRWDRSVTVSSSKRGNAKFPT